MDARFHSFLDHVYVSNNMVGSVNVVYNINDGKFDPTNTYFPNFYNIGPVTNNLIFLDIF